MGQACSNIRKQSLTLGAQPKLQAILSVCVCVEVATRENGGAVNPFHVMQVLEHNLMDKCLEAKLDTESEEPNQNFRQSSACVEVAQSIAWQHDYF